MAQFEYTAVNNTGKKLTGVIGAPSEEDARKQLGSFGISVLSIKKTSDSSEESQTLEAGTSNELKKFEFEAYDKANRKVLGTIPASNRYKAFKRLVEEYEFEVSYIVPIGSSEEDKAKARQEDLSALKAQYQEQNSPEEKVQESSNPAFEQKRAALLERVDSILEKIKELLQKFDGEIKPENKKVIETYINKLLRIKNSTNLDYIEHTSEELLKKIQDQELFLHKEKNREEKERIRLQSQTLMAQLHARPSEQKSISDNLSNLQERFNTSESRFLKSIGAFINRFLPSPEEKILKQKIKSTKKQAWTFRKIWLKAPPSAKTAARESLDAILKEKEKLEKELKQLKKREKADNKSNASQQGEREEPLVSEEVNQFLGWLLAFYLIAYFISHYLLAKTLTKNPLPGDFNLLESSTLRTLLISLFLWYVLLSIRIEYFRYRRWATALILPIGALLNATLIFNL